MEVAAKRKEKRKKELPSMEVNGEDLAYINSSLGEYGRKKRSIVNILHELQDKYHYLPKELLEIVSRELKIPYNQVFALGTFYDAFFMKPLGKYRIDICHGTTCYNEKASKIVETLEDYMEVEVGNTREDGLFSLLDVHCIGCCSIAPCIRIDNGDEERVYGYQTPEKAVSIIEKIEKSEEKFKVTDDLIQKVMKYIKDRKGKIVVSEAADNLNLEKEQFKEVIEEMEERNIIKKQNT